MRQEVQPPECWKELARGWRYRWPVRYRGGREPRPFVIWQKTPGHVPKARFVRCTSRPHGMKPAHDTPWRLGSQDSIWGQAANQKRADEGACPTRTTEGGVAAKTVKFAGGWA